MLQVIIIEDEPRGRETLKNLLTQYCSDIDIVGMAGSVKRVFRLYDMLIQIWFFWISNCIPVQVLKSWKMSIGLTLKLFLQQLLKIMPSVLSNSAR